MICTKCGAEVADGFRFCNKCGNPLEGTENTGIRSLGVHIEKYEGEERVFPLLGKELYVSKELDAFMYYRKKFKEFARVQADLAKADYCRYVTGLDEFMNIFPEIYCRYLKPLLQKAFEIILSYGIYDITAEDFAKQHTEDFCAADKTMNTMQEACNNTIIANENAIHKMYGSIPNIGFIGGLGTVLAVEAANIAIDATYKSAINKVNIKPAQKIELFNRINHEMLMMHVFKDYWDVAFSLCYRLYTHDCGMWYPTVEGNERANGLMKNLESGLIPPSDRSDVIIQIFKNRPIQDSLYGYLRRTYAGDEEVDAVRRYFGYA